MSRFKFDRTPDRIDINESDGKRFYGFDDDNGDGTRSTTWYDERGDVDCITDVPEDDD